MSDRVRKYWNRVTTVLVALVVILTVALAGVRLIGLTPYTVLSGSMEPNYHVGSLIYVRRVDYTSLQVGDPITFLMNEDTVATHRIVEILEDEQDPSVLRFRTKGDANASADGTLVHYKNLIGKPVFTIPYLGYLVEYIHNPPGMYFAISSGVLLLLLVFLPDLLVKAEKPEQLAQTQEQKEK